MSDLISRQEAIDSLTEIIMNLKNVYGDMGSAVNGAREYIKSLPSAEPKWTPVTEALPKVRTDVLLAFEKNMAVGFYSYGCWNVNIGNGFYTGVFTDKDKPIAWMPLPEPAKIGDRE